MPARFNPTVVVVAALVVGLAAAYTGYAVGVNGTIARGAFVNAMFVREEAKCIQSGDVECLRLHWHHRAQAVAQSARSSMGAVGASSVEQELRAYVQWAEQLSVPTGASR